MKTAIVHAQQKWEHSLITRRSETALLDDLNRAGEEGWELVSVFYYKDPLGNTTWAGFLKRPKVPGAAKGSAPGASSSQDQGPAKDSTEPAGFDLSGEVFDVKP